VDRADSVGRAVESVLANGFSSFELVVIDQSTTSATEDACARFKDDPRFRYIHSAHRGLSRAYNRGIFETSAPLIAFTDDDCVAHADWLVAISNIFEREPDVDMIYGQTLHPPEGEAPGEVIPTLAFEGARRIDGNSRLEVIGMGANFALRRSLIEAIGPFDEALGGGGPLRSSQDYDLQFRAYRAGKVVRLSPEVNVDHYGARAVGAQWNKTLEAYGFGDGAFYGKHIRCKDADALRLATTHLWKLLVREMLNPIRRKPTKWPYIRSFVQGMRAGWRYPIDRTTRIYIPRSDGTF
jgi:GT2 family glycosyltransferase